MKASCPDSPRLSYRPFNGRHIQFALDYLSDPVRTRYLPNAAPYPAGLAAEWAALRISHWEKYGFGTFVLYPAGGIEPIGFCGLEHAKNSDFIDIRYGLIHNAWGKGLAMEAGRTILYFGFKTLKLDKIYGAAVPENKPSIEILKKLGMVQDPEFDVYGDSVDTFSIKSTMPR